MSKLTTLNNNDSKLNYNLKKKIIKSEIKQVLEENTYVCCKYPLSDVFFSISNVFNIPTAAKIIPNLFIGNIKMANNNTFLENNNIQNVIIVSNKTYPTKYDNITYNYVEVSSKGNGENLELFFEKMDASVDILEDFLRNNEKVLVVCPNGNQRASTLICCYLMKYFKLDSFESIKFIKNRSPNSFLFFPFYHKTIDKFNKFLEDEEWNIL